MSANFGLMQLVAGEGFMSKYFPCKQVEALINFNKEYYPNIIKIPNMFDTIREIFLIIKLPALPNNLCGFEVRDDGCSIFAFDDYYDVVLEKHCEKYRFLSSIRRSSSKVCVIS